MSQLIHCNTYFEFELSGQHCFPLSSYLEKAPLLLQLQFIPLIFADSDDHLLVSHRPPDEYLEKLQGLFSHPLPQICTLDAPAKALKLKTWGASQDWASWAKQHKISYEIPPWESIKTVNSKAFSHQHRNCISGSQVIYNKAELIQWIDRYKAPFVLKTLYGVAATGNLRSQAQAPFLSKKQERLIAAEWKKGNPIIAERWLERKADFSSHWNISQEQEISYIGLTKIENASSGSFISALYSNDESRLNLNPAFIKQHQDEARQILEKIALAGYYGPVGIDAMICFDSLENTEMHNILEINARQTMALACILCQKKHYPDKTLLLEYSRDSKLNTLLPSEINYISGDLKLLPKQISLNIINED